MRTSRLATSMLCTVTVGILLTASTAATAQTAGGAGSLPGTAGLGQTTRITLITGDVAELTTGADGTRSARLVDGGSYYLGDFDGELTVVPTAAYGMFTQGRLDRRLFNLTDLVAQGYDDAHTARLPLLLTSTGTSAPRTPSAATTRRTLASVGTTAIAVDKSQAKKFWDSIDSGPSLRSTGASKIWLDGRTHATLDRSTKQIAAPTVWQAGYDGKGVKVAVLDTGYDANHPDLKQQVVAAESFIPDQDVQDLHGHGTHTASTVAGLGTASGGKRKGVAPGAELLIGKVLDNTGGGSDSEAIAGMEWAVQQGAKVVSMSLGGWPSDGTDPMSEAVDRLSKSSGALFVIAAGNSGAEETVGSPGAAASALTVGAVDRDDKLAWFSSRGPRVGDGAMKPEVTAPGVEIAAARAAGSTEGHQLDEYYTTMSGTSMATPHVAGAAAILAQRHPDWSGQQLKAALASTAVDSTATAAQEGLGRIDLAKALDPKILADTANLYFGDLSWSGATPPQPVVRTVAYRNNSRTTQHLDLTIRATSPGGVKPALTVSPVKLTIPPGGTATASVRIDLAKTQSAKYFGELVARGSGSSYRTGVGFAAGGRLNQVTVKAIDRDGKPAAGSPMANSGVQLWNQDTGEVNGIIFDETGSRTLEVPTGRYSVMAYVMGPDEAGWTKSVALLGDPDEWISGDRTFTFDARKANKVTVKTPRPADLESVGIAWHRKVGDRQAVSGFGFGDNVADGIYVQDFGKVPAGTFQVVQRWDLAQPKLTVDVTGAGGFRLPTPAAATFDTTYVGNEKVELVNAGDGTPVELENAKDKVALIRWRDYDQTQTQIQAAKDAGAKVVFLYNEQPGFWSDGAELGIPVYLLRAAEGAKLVQLLSQRPVTLQLTGLLDSAYHYDLAAGPEQVRGPLTYDFARMRPAVVTTNYHRNDGWRLHVDQRIARLPGLQTGLSATRLVAGPVTRTDYLASDVSGINWSERTAAGEWNESGFEYSLGRTYRPNELTTRDWWASIARPAIPELTGGEADGLPVARFENAIRVAIPQYVNGDRTVYGWADNRGDRTDLKLSSNGKELGRKDWSVAQFPVPAGTAWYDLTLDVQRSEDTWAKTSTATHTEWRFRSGTTKSRAVLPLVQVDYRLDGNRLELTPGYQPGVRGTGFFRTTAELSYDGKTWQRLPVLSVGGRATAWIPGGAQSVSLRVTATDVINGNRISQTIEKPW
ncbi:subtilisin family serine protease [Kribbella sp. VKM Ac-2527]|uniref:Subtilisin family serine protease n=1 Tax=Kribbella caucasensis TaxID=2512215 RepID=A0A4V3C8Y3_9ACTN|nr:S8 family serine peptidase [Kribbella sp. VKM Ac-2527]TDO43168.1 subtilisin family serine protease [Kribbella sp. VKM Ac-2527]